MSSGDMSLDMILKDPEQAIPATKVELSVSCRKLRDMDVFSKSDPMCVLYIKILGSESYREVGRTEVISNNLNPKFVKKFLVDYFFEEVQHLKFEVYDIDSRSTDLSQHESVHLQRGPSKNAGHITVRGEELSSCRDMIYMKFRGEHLDKKDTFGKSDPFLLIYRENLDEGFTVCHKTEIIKKTLNPSWKEFSILSRSLCNGDYDRRLKFECYDWDSDGGHDLIGIFETTSRELSRGPGPSNVYEVSDPRQPTSLHYMNPYQPNHYIRALRAVGEVIEDYDTDKLFPALGFGARVPPHMQVSHEFFMNGDPYNPFCQGVQGILDAYQRTLATVQLYGPTNFAPVINHVARFASAKTDGSEYFILLIITDGIITDLPHTKQAIVYAARLPMSIIIVGVGNEDFSAMEVLDGDEVRLSYQGVQAERDIVQFVPFRNFENNSDAIVSQAQLAKEVLAEIPDQFLSYMRKHQINPKPRRGSLTSIASHASAMASAPPMILLSDARAELTPDEGEIQEVSKYQPQAKIQLKEGVI
ncbi:Copine-8 [Holothuria leucospilota]|uniref:Copine-3 n=1 Tax=Holothuria leucospilota TaxID=206669 RepID=A0A9Q1HFK8_HOLLE|nr:Copine-8 [Holothuria leucospilota]